MVAGILAFSHAETLQAHGFMSEALEFEMHLSSFRVWIQRGTNETLGTIVGVEPSEVGLVERDRVRARAELEEIRRLVSDDPAQLQRVDELGALLERRIRLEDAALAAYRSGGASRAAAVLSGSPWQDDRLRVRSLTNVMLDEARLDARMHDADYRATMWQARIALAAGVLLMIGTLAFLLRQLRVANRTREELVQAHELARQRLAELEGVLDAVPAAVLLTRDPEARDVRGNRYAEALVRMERGANLSFAAPPGRERPKARYLRDGVEVPARDLPLEAAARTGQPVESQQLDVVAGDGASRHVLVTAVPLLDAAGEPRGAVSAAVDVSDVVRVAHELRIALEENRRLLASAHRGELLYREMARNFPNGAIALFDRDLRFLVFDGTRLALPRDPSIGVGRTLGEIFSPEIAAQLEPIHRDALEGREGRTELTVAGRAVEVRASPVRDETGAVIMGIAVSQDVTEERSLRGQLALSSRLASLGTLVAGVAHEVNNPLAGTVAGVATAIEDLRGIAAGLRAGAASDRESILAGLDEVVEILLDAQGASARIARIVKDLALFGRPNPVRERVRLGDVVMEAMRWLPASLGNAATIEVTDLGAPDVHASAGQLEQVVVNLVTNAAAAVPEGRRGRVSIRLSRTEGGRAVLEVQDDGRGIDPATMERIFDPFFTTREVGKGVGLGLPICHAIATAHGGTLTANSEPGVGSTFRLELPPVSTME